MIFITRCLASTGHRRTKYPIYTELEAKHRKLDYCYWRDIDKDNPPKFGMSDDGYVGEYMKTYMVGAKKVRPETCLKHPILHKFIHGIADVHSKREFLFLERKAFHDYNSLRPQSIVESTAKKKVYQRFVRLYAEMMIAGVVRWDILASSLNMKDDKKTHVKKRIIKILKRRGIEKMLSAELQKLFKDTETDEKYVLTTIKEAVTLAKENSNPDVMLKGAKQLGIYLHMEGQSAHQLPPKYRDDLDEMEAEIDENFDENKEIKETGGKVPALSEPVPDGGEDAMPPWEQPN